MKRFAIAIAAAALMINAAPVLAAPGMSVTLSGIGNGAVVSGTVSLNAEGSSALGVKSLAIQIDGVTVASKDGNGNQQNMSVGYSWDTTVSTGSSQIARNGEYSIRATGSATGGSSDDASITVLVDNAPATPSGVAASPQGEGISVTWNANPEPDIVGYRVERDSGSGFGTAGTTDRTSFFDGVGPGTHNYRVVALRSSPSTTGGKPSSPSSSASATINAAAGDPGSDGSGYSDGGAGGDTGGTSGGFDGGYQGGGSGLGSTKHGGGSGFGGGIKSTKNGFVTSDGRRFGASGLGISGGLALPGLTGFGNFPSLSNTSAVEWGSFEKKLPYQLEKGVQEAAQLVGTNIAAKSPWRIIPPDGLRWVAAGLLVFVIALALQFASLRLKELEATQLTEA